MTSLELKRLIKRGESRNLDFKKTITHIYKIAKTISSFANSVGGVLLIGVEDNGVIVGTDPDEEIYLIDQAANHYCDPYIPYSHYTVEDRKENWRVLVVEISESQVKPHKSVNNQGEWNVYIRTNDKSMLASKHAIKHLRNDVIRANKPQKKFTAQEKKLMEYLENNERVTVQIFSKLVNISDRRARRILIKLSNEGVLFIHDLEKETYYTRV